MSEKYTVYADIEAHDKDLEDTSRDDAWHPSEERDLAEFSSLEEAEKFMVELPKFNHFKYMNSEEDAEFFRKLSGKYLDMKVEMQEIANLLMELYTDINDTAEPEVYGSILGIHERIELFLEATHG